MLDVETRSNTTRTEMTVDCSYAKHNITLCVQFSSNLCVSNNVSITTSECECVDCILILSVAIMYT